jgi:dihydroorotate dehydrogenase
MDFETIHKLHLLKLSMGLGGRAPSMDETRLRQNILGLDFANPLGLAAGYDKYSVAVKAFEDLGFGFVELGSISPLPQQGNPRPRMHKLSADRAMINHMGLNNPGHAITLERVRKARSKLSRMKVAVNLVKGRDQEEPALDYVSGMKALHEVADLFVLNLSCPNVTSCKNLQDPEESEKILIEVSKCRKQDGIKVPVFIKIGPDLPPDKLEKLTGLCVDHGIDGIVAVNLTHDRPKSLKTRNLPEKGGLSGPPMRSLATKTVSQIYKYSGGKLVIIGIGGISNAEDAYEKIKAGASLLEFYTGLVYHGMGLTHEIATGLDRLLERDGFANIAEATGTGN